MRSAATGQCDVDDMGSPEMTSHESLTAATAKTGGHSAWIVDNVRLLSGRDDWMSDEDDNTAM